MHSLQIELEIRKSIKNMVRDFFSSEINKDGKEQLMAISTFDLNNLAYIFPTDKSFINQLQKFKDVLADWFAVENNVNFLAVRLESLNFVIISNFGLDIVKKMNEELIEYLINLKFSERDKTTSFLWKLVHIKSFWKRKREIKEYNKMKQIYAEEIRDMFHSFPCLWLIPFLSENASAIIEK